MNAFSCSEKELERKWELIPDDTDVILTHVPPLGVLDQGYKGEVLGSSSLIEQAIPRVMPKAVVFGHNHDEQGMVMLHLPEGNVLCVNAAATFTHKAMIFDLLY